MHRIPRPLPAPNGRRLGAFAAAWLVALTAGLAAGDAQAAPPAFPANDVPETFFGTTVHDPYRALESKDAAEVVAWMKAQDEHARTLLASIPGRASLVERLQKYDDAASSRVTGVTRETGGLWFYKKRGATENQFKLYLRQGLVGAERLLVDPEAVGKASGKPHAINYFNAAPGGRKMAYGLSAQGSEQAELQVVDSASGRVVGGPSISRANFGGVSWTHDKRQLAFNRLQEMTPGLADTEKYQRSQVLLRTPGTPAGTPRPVFGLGCRGSTSRRWSCPSSISATTAAGHWAWWPTAPSAS